MSDPEPGPPATDDGEVIIVIARPRTGGFSTGSGIAIRVSRDGTNDASDWLPRPLRNAFGVPTDFDIDEDFPEAVKDLIVQALSGLALHATLGEYFTALLQKRVDVDFHLARPGELGDAHARISGRKPDGTVSNGAYLNIEIDITYGGQPRSLYQIVISIIHELIHALGVPELDARLHQDLFFDQSVTNDIFGSSVPSLAVDRVYLIEEPASNGSLLGDSGFEAFAGSEEGTTFSPGAGGSLIFAGSGDDNIVAIADGMQDILQDSGGSDIITLPDGVVRSDVTIRNSPDGLDVAILVRGRPEIVIIGGGTEVGRVELIRIAGVDHSIANIASSTNTAPDEGSQHVSVSGDFYGGYLGFVSGSDLDGDVLTYKLSSIYGAYSYYEWEIDSNTGNILGNFSRPNQDLHDWTYLTVEVSDGLSTSFIGVSVHWSPESDLPVFAPVHEYSEYIYQDYTNSPRWTDISAITDFL